MEITNKTLFSIITFTCFLLFVISIPEVFAQASPCWPSGWEDMEIEAKWDTDQTAFNNIINSFVEGEEKYEHSIDVRWGGEPRKYVDKYYDENDILFNDLHMLRDRIRYQTTDNISANAPINNLINANWNILNWEKVQYKSTPTLLSSTWFRAESGGEQLNSAQVAQALEGNYPFPTDDPIALLLADHPSFIFPVDDSNVVSEVTQFRYRIQLLDENNVGIYEISLDRIITNGVTPESFGVELEVIRPGNRNAQDIMNLFYVASLLQNEFNLTPATKSKGGIEVEKYDCGSDRLEFDTNSYTPSDTAYVFLVSASANQNSNLIDHTALEISSTTDPGGIDITLKETGPDRGVFTSGPITLTLVDESSGHRIRVNTCDIITAAAEGLSDTAQVSCDIKFAAIGDYGDDSTQEQAVSNLVKSWNPDFIITVGDNNYPFGEAFTIDRNIGKYYHEFIGNYQGSFGEGSLANRFFPSIGNHDWNSPSPTGGDLSPYLDYFTLLGNERYYDFVKGPVHFFAFNSDTREPDGVSIDSIQADWLQTGLSNSESTWNIVFFHHSPYTSGLHSQDAELSSLRDIPFREWGANVVLGGHDHDYERLLVDDGSGQIPYFVNGVGGSDIRSFSPSILPESQFQYNEMPGAMLIEANTDCLSFKMFNISNEMIDSYFIGDCQTIVLPNLVVSSMTHLPASPDTNDLMTFTATVKNQGTASASATTLMFKIGEETPGGPNTLFDIPALASGASSVPIERVLTLSVAQNYRNTSTADYFNVVGESNEADNTLTDDFTVTRSICAIATATYGSEMAPQVQMLREVRDNILLNTESGVVFMGAFNEVYYSFSPMIADWEKENPTFKEMVKLFITPMIMAMGIMSIADATESDVLFYGLSTIGLVLGMYIVAPVVSIIKIRKHWKKYSITAKRASL